MLIVVDPHSGVPVYRQLMDQIRFHIASGLLAPGEEVPSTRALSAQLGINPMTVSKAYALLEEEGVLVRRPGLPSVVRPLAGEELRAEKMERLRELLAPIATAVRQLGLDPEQAAEVFREMLSGVAAERE